MRRPLLMLGLLLGAGAAVPAVPWGFSQGRAPLDGGGEPPRAAECGACHSRQLAGWSASRHKAAWTNDLMTAGYAAERQDFCVHCHAPWPTQKAEIHANRDFWRSLDLRAGGVPGSVQRKPTPHADDGVDCAACHWRNGQVLAGQDRGGAPHVVRPTTELSDGTLCIQCHEFNVPQGVDGQLTLTDVPMQATGTEWRAWRAAGGTETCADCHMPGGDHHVRGAHDRAWLAASLHARVAEYGGQRVLHLSTVGVGHHLPTGDLFRHVTVEVREGDAWRVVDRIGRRYEVVWHGAEPRKELVADTALRPGVVRDVVLPAQGAWRVVWHDGAEHDEQRGLLVVADITAVLVEGP